ncbi:MAG TPA: alpha/beta fold hydrolase [Marmoricola sp.]|nr:alpha/beta fold hydrolase [Marmoricola sp.]
MSSPTVRTPGLVLTDHRIAVPLDHDDPAGESIEVFAREVAAPDGRDRPFLVYLQGGPGHESPRPTGRPSSPGWLGRALRDFRVLMLDQRGTGLSTPYGGRQAGGAQDAERLVHFRADAIVRDAETLREHLGVRQWSVLGQSFGGFCALHYLGDFPDSLREVFFTGGLPPVGRPVDQVYAATFEQMRRLNVEHHQRFPQDADRLRGLLDRCAAGDVRLSDGQHVTPRVFRTIGNQLGLDGGSEAVHYLLEGDPSHPAFGHDLAALLPFSGRNPLYAVVHESCYADGGATRWSAERVQPEDFGDDSILLTGEHVYSWHFEDCADLVPYRPAAERLAAHEWPRLHHADRLAATDVPCAAAIYAEDAFVDRRFSEETADLIPGMRRWLTDEYHHNGLRTDGGRVLDRLIGLARGTV